MPLAKTIQKSLLRAAALFGSLLPATSAFAEEHGGETHGHELVFVLLVINFVAYVILMSVLYKKKVSPQLVARSKGVRSELQRAAAELAREQEELSKLREALESIDDDEEEVIAGYREEGLRSAEALRKQALEEANRMEQEAGQLKENLFHQIESEVRHEMASLALKKAEERLKSGFTPEMDRTLRRDVIQTFVQ
jgi:F0F1-type ATP synthase membrane subunit b/b'